MSRPPSLFMTAGAATLMVCSLLTSFASSPLFPLYTAEWGLRPWQVSVAFMGYPVGVLVVVLLLGGLSDRIGRRTAMLLGAGMIVVACAVTAVAWALPVLVAGRVLQGMASGVVAGTTAAALQDFHPKGPNAGSVTHSLCTSLGMCVGPLMAGTLAPLVSQWHASAPLVVPYVVIAVFALVPVAFVLRAPGDRRVAGPARIIRPVSVPRKIWLPFSIAAATLMTLNGCMAVFGTFGARILSEGAGISSTGGTGTLLTVLVGSTLVSQLALRRLPASTCILLAAPMITVGAGTVAAALYMTSAVATFAGACLIGFGGGLALMGGTRLIGAVAPLDRRAEMYGAWMVIAFVMLGGTSLVSGLALGDAPLSGVMAVAAATFAVLAAFVLANARRLHLYLTASS